MYNTPPTSSMRLVIKNDATTERSSGKQTKNITHLRHKHGDLLKPAGREYFSQNEDGEIVRLQRGEPDMTRVTSDNLVFYSTGVLTHTQIINFISMFV